MITIEDAHEQEMISLIDLSIDYLEQAMNVVESDNNYNKGQSQRLNKIYDIALEAMRKLRSI
jgi:hypothetical protein